LSTNYIVIAAVGALVVVLAVFMIVRSAKPASRPCGGCKRNMLPTWSKCLFCGWVPGGARLEFIAGPIKGQSISLSGEVTTIGSLAGNTIVLNDPAVSKKHAGIRRGDNGYELADLGSSNGIYVNGQKVPKKSLNNGEIVRVGNSEAVFKLES
jgi:hypothetical protein